MKATIPYIEQKFDEFNQLMFSGKLPKIPIELSNAKTFLGVCAYKKRRGWDGKKICYDFKLRISTRIDLPEKEIEDTIIHEMIHYFIGYNQLQDTSAHGQLFRKMMNTINETYGRNITISHKLTQEQREEIVDTKAHWRVVAIVSLHDGRCGVKVLPRVAQSILYYYNKMRSFSEIANIQLYLSNDIFFNRFPKSKALNFFIMDKSQIMPHLKDTNKVFCDGFSLTTA